jgi:hypothetical protein
VNEGWLNYGADYVIARYGLADVFALVTAKYEGFGMDGPCTYAQILVMPDESEPFAVTVPAAELRRATKIGDLQARRGAAEATAARTVLRYRRPPHHVGPDVRAGQGVLALPATGGVKTMHMELKTQRQKTSEALRILARAMDHGLVEDTIGEVKVNACYNLDASSTQMLIEALEDMTFEDWDGDSGWEYRTYTGRLFGRTVAVLVERPKEGQ